VPATDIAASMPGARILYAASRDPADRTSLVGVDREHERALLEITRPGLGAPTQLVTVDLAHGAMADAWSPSQALSRTIDVGNTLGPRLADTLDAGAAFQADLVGWASRLAAAGAPWSDDTLATTPQGKHIFFASGPHAWVTGPDGARPSAIGVAGRGVLSPDGDGLAWTAVVDRVRAPPTRLVMARLTGGGNPDAISGILDPRGVTWSHDGKHLYLVAKDVRDAGLAGSCLYAVEATTHIAKMLACTPGEMLTLALSADDRFAVLCGPASGTLSRVSQADVTYVALADGRVKSHQRVPLQASAGIVDDAGLFVMSDGVLVAAVDLATGRQKVARSSAQPGVGALQVGGWIAPRSLVTLRSTDVRAILERIDVDALVPMKPD
jgi:hypothetical protein